VPTLEVDRPDGGRDAPLAPPLPVDRARARTSPRRPFFTSMPSTRPCAASCRVRRSRSRPPLRTWPSHRSSTCPAGAARARACISAANAIARSMDLRSASVPYSNVPVAIEKPPVPSWAGKPNRIRCLLPEAHPPIFSNRFSPWLASPAGVGLLQVPAGSHSPDREAGRRRPHSIAFPGSLILFFPIKMVERLVAAAARVERLRKPTR